MIGYDKLEKKRARNRIKDKGLSKQEYKYMGYDVPLKLRVSEERRRKTGYTSGLVVLSSEQNSNQPKSICNMHHDE